MRKLFVSFMSLALFISCQNKNNEMEQINIYNIGGVNVTVKGKSEFKELKGIDTYVAQINTGKDTFNIEYGKGVYDLHEGGPTIFPADQKANIEKLSGNKIQETGGVFFSETPEKDREERIFSKQFYLYDTINSIIVKIVQPKKIGYGITGLYVPKLRDGNSFSIYAKGLDSMSHKKALLMFKTVSYH